MKKILNRIINNYTYIVYVTSLILSIVYTWNSIQMNDNMAILGWAIASMYMCFIIHYKYKVDKISKELQETIRDLIEALNKK